MTLVHYSQPRHKITITHSAVDYQFEGKTVRADVLLQENAVSQLRLTASDYKGESFLSQSDIGDNVKYEFKYADGNNTYTQTFGGWITDLEPALTTEGELLRVTALGYGVGLVNMMVRQQYGNQSENPTINKIEEILTDAGDGIVPKYVMKVLNTATNSGYNLNTTKVADLASDFSYLYFPGKPAIKCLEDMIDLIRAANVPNAGAHWIVVPDGTTAYLCLATVGAHENPPADVWPTWWKTDQAGSTIEVTKDMVASGFRKKRSEANYILFVGNFRRPANGDIWTENNSGDWGTEVDMTVADEAVIYKIGVKSIRGRLINNLDTGGFYYPGGADLNFNVTNIGTKHTIPRIGFYLQRDAQVNMAGSPPFIELGTGAVAGNNYYAQYLTDEIPTAGEWYHLSFPIGPYYSLDETTEWEWLSNNAPDWADIDYINFWFAATGANADLYVDGLYFQGLVTRAAYDTTKIGTQKCKIKLYRDDVPKDDSLIASDDTGQIGQFCKAELYRAVTEPIIGQIVIPMRETIKAGQLAHIHGARKATGFNIDKDMRIVQVRHHLSMQGALSYLTLTDDVLNSQPIQPTDAYNALIKAVAPGFQDRARGSLISQQVDIDQVILGKSYAT